MKNISDIDKRIAELHIKICKGENDISLLKNLLDIKEMDEDFIEANMKELFFRNRN